MRVYKGLSLLAEKVRWQCDVRVCYGVTCCGILCYRILRNGIVCYVVERSSREGEARQPGRRTRSILLGIVKFVRVAEHEQYLCCLYIAYVEYV